MTASVKDFRYQVRVLDASAAVVAVYDDLTACYCKSIVNSPGIAILTVPSDHPIIAFLHDDLVIDIQFGYPVSNALRYQFISLFLGLYRDSQIATDENGDIYYLLYFPGILEALSRAIVAYYPDTTNKTRFNGIDIAAIMYTLVVNNCTTAATTANGRLRTINPVINFSGVSSATIHAISYSCAYRNVLEALQELAAIGSVDFIPSRVGTSYTITFSDNTTSDISSSLIFALDLHNLEQANLNGDRLREKTVALVGGPGEANKRAFAVRTGANFSTTNDYEVFVDARGSAVAELADIGDTRLAEGQARAVIDANILQSSGYMFGRDYTLGNIVSVLFGGAVAAKKIAEVEISFRQDSDSEIKIGLRDA